jgi:hypothetical protein
MTKIGAGGKFDKDSIKFLEDCTVLGFCSECTVNHLTATVHSSDGKSMNKNMKKEKRYIQ